MIRNRFIPFAVMFVALCAASNTSDYPPLKGHPVLDAADVLSAEDEARLERRVADINTRTSHQLVVATVPSLHGRDVADYANRYFRVLKLGQKGVNDGVLLMLAPRERKVRIEVGYGLEPQLTDAAASVIIATAIVPPLKAGRTADALIAGADAIGTIIVPDPSAAKPQTAFADTAAPKTLADGLARLAMLSASLAVLFGIGWLVTRKSRAADEPDSLLGARDGSRLLQERTATRHHAFDAVASAHFQPGTFAYRDAARRSDKDEDRRNAVNRQTPSRDDTDTYTPPRPSPSWSDNRSSSSSDIGGSADFSGGGGSSGGGGASGDY